ncbi:response regulator [Thermosediminibacter oceani]|uniref:Stage 0 sporulation protein A homolog n=1 Tax=Thermosediminibacter oceani (strain ATCC BAA-1034 / DSM 16646 / JW/IW-1228P) TaxID=555079 RepID=D9S059_THEOJ|nr:response regulator [Thermosediminibacter oceani]ADL06987.1 response regulator receiver protein [Thermosediminibacter oceani DSM 16646]
MGYKRKILVVDDQEWVRKMLLEALAVLGYEAFGASSGPEALQLAVEKEPDLAVIDVSIPGMDGLTLLSKFREKDLKIPGILISGNGEKNCIEKALKEGAFAYLVKPFDIGDLEGLIKQALTS